MIIIWALIVVAIIVLTGVGIMIWKTEDES